MSIDGANQIQLLGYFQFSLPSIDDGIRFLQNETEFPKNKKAQNLIVEKIGSGEIEPWTSRVIRLCTDHSATTTPTPIFYNFSKWKGGA